MNRVAAILLLTLVAAAGRPGPSAPPVSVVTLAPHLAELVYAAGAGDRLTGVSAHTDYPPAVQDVPRIGDAFRVDLERIAVLAPDLVLAWQGGTPQALITQLRELGYPVLELSTGSVAEIATAIRRIGERLGTRAAAEAAAERFLADLERAVAGHADRPRVRVFYQVAERPLYTINGQHFISELIRRCGGENIFADLDDLAPVVTVEAVLARDPEVILAPSGGEDELAYWRRWESISAVAAGNLRTLPPDTLTRPTPRLVRGATDICRALEQSRRALIGACGKLARPVP